MGTPGASRGFGRQPTLCLPRRSESRSNGVPLRSLIFQRPHPRMNDLRFAVRQLFKNPGYSAVAVLTLALGTGFVTTLFTMISGVVYGRLPFEDSERVVSISVPAAAYDDLVRQQTSCDSVAFAVPTQHNLKVDSFVSRYPAAVVSPNFLEVLRASPVIGRGFLSDDGRPGAMRAVLLGHSVWEREFQSARDIVGRRLRVNGEDCSVVGVMPQGFGFPFHQEVWTARRADEPVTGGLVFGRLRSGVSPGSASTEFTQLANRLQEASQGSSAAETFRWDSDTPLDPSGKAIRVEVVPFAQRTVKEALRRMLTAILGATFLVLLLACANVANLILARSVDRRKEMAIRAALGAGRPRLIRQMLLESLVVAGAGSAVGLWFASLGTRWIWDYIMTERPLTGGAPFWMNFNVDGRVFLFTATVAVVATLLTGLVPAFKASQIAPIDAIKESSGGGRRMSRWTHVLINVQMAFSVCLVTVAGLFATVLVAFNHKSLPYDPRLVYTARVSLDAQDYEAPEVRTRFFEGLLAQLESAPGVAAAGLISSESLRLSDIPPIEMEGGEYARDGDRPRCVFEAVSPGFLNAFGVGLLRGRMLEERDRAGAERVALVNIDFAKRFGRNGDILGRRFRVAGDPANPGPWVTIVGITPDLGSIKAGQISRGPVIYSPMAQSPYRAMTLLVRSSSDSSDVVKTLRTTVAALDSELPVTRVQTVQSLIEMERVGMNTFGVLFVVCGFGALMLAGVGLFGVVSQGVRLRTREFGIRLALGANRNQLLRMVLRQGLGLIGIGTGIGVLLALASSVGLRSMIPEFSPSPYDVWIYAAVVAALAAIGAAALWIPARRAAASDPIDALRTE